MGAKMGSSFNFRVAKGVRVRVSSKGVRTSIGSRGARVHIGGGRGPAFSTSAGPFTYYTSLGGARSSASRSHATAKASYRQALAHADKAEQARVLADAFNAILDLHNHDFPPASKPVAPAPLRSTRMPSARATRWRH